MQINLNNNYHKNKGAVPCIEKWAIMSSSFAIPKINQKYVNNNSCKLL